MKKQQIPSNATLVHSWPVFKIYQWQQEMFDGSYQTFEKAARNDVVKAILIEWEHIIMLDEHQPWKHKINFSWWCVEDGETVETAIRREVQEETGYSIWDLSFFFSTSLGRRMDGNVHYYIWRSLKKTANPKLDSWEKIKIIRKTFDEFIKFICSDESDADMIYILKKYIIPHQHTQLKDLLFHKGQKWS